MSDVVDRALQALLNVAEDITADPGARVAAAQAIFIHEINWK